MEKYRRITASELDRKEKDFERWYKSIFTDASRSKMHDYSHWVYNCPLNIDPQALSDLLDEKFPEAFL